MATALSEGESKKKHVILLEILDQSFRCVKQELQTVRPFRYAQVSTIVFSNSKRRVTGGSSQETDQHNQVSQGKLQLGLDNTTGRLSSSVSILDVPTDMTLSWRNQSPRMRWLSTLPTL